MKKLILFLILISASAQARNIGNAYDPNTGSTVYFNQDSRGNIDAYDPSTGKTVYFHHD